MLLPVCQVNIVVEVGLWLQVARDELLDEEEYSDIVDDISEEIETKYGHITAISIPRPATPDDRVSPTLLLLVLLVGMTKLV